MKKIVAIVVTYNGAEWIDKCLNSLRLSEIPLEIIVIDNGSTDGTQEIINRKFPEIDFLQSEKNLGFGAGNNIGIKSAIEKGADFVFLLNQDAWIENDSIKKLVEVFADNQDFGILSPVHFNGSGDLLDQYFLNHILSDNRKLVSDLFLNKLNSCYEVEFVNAAAWLVNISCIKKVGFFDPLFFHYGEDENFASRCKYFGYKIGIVPDSYIYHDREEVIKRKTAQNKIDYNYLKNSWLVKMTDINNKNWSEKYNKELIVFLMRIASRSDSNKTKILFAFKNLRKLKKEISAVRNRMLKGYNGY